MMRHQFRVLAVTELVTERTRRRAIARDTDINPVPAAATKADIAVAVNIVGPAVAEE